MFLRIKDRIIGFDREESIHAPARRERVREHNGFSNRRPMGVWYKKRSAALSFCGICTVLTCVFSV